MGAAGGELDVPVGFVFDYYDVVFGAEGIDFLAAFDGKGSTGWILADAVRKGLVCVDEKDRMTYVTVYIRCGLFPFLSSQFAKTSSSPPGPEASMPSSSILTGTTCNPLGLAVWIAFM